MMLERRILFPGTGPVSARSTLNQPRGCARERVTSTCIVKRLASQSEVTPTFIRALSVAPRGAGARDDSREVQRSLRHGSQTRPRTSARLLLQLDDLFGPSLHTRRLVPAAAGVCACCVRIFFG